jgi:hypothetical protein
METEGKEKKADGGRVGNYLWQIIKSGVMLEGSSCLATLTQR